MDFVAIFKCKNRSNGRTYYKRRRLPSACIGDIEKAALEATQLPEPYELVAIITDDLLEKFKKGHKLRLVAN